MTRLLPLLLLAAAPAPSLQERVAAQLAAASPGTRFGLVVADADGREVVALLPDQRFIPASNTKMFTTATAFATLPDLDRPDADGGAAVRLEEGDVVLAGHGDARLSAAADCAVDCLATLADAVAARTRRVRDVVGDDSAYPDERWSPGMSWNNIPTRSGTATSALTLDDNEVELVVTPGGGGATPTVTLPPYYTVDNRAVTVTGTGGRTDIGFDRAPGSFTVRLWGTIAAEAKPERLHLGVDDPAHYAAWTFRRMLEARGVRVTGRVDVRHRPLTPADDPAVRGTALPARAPAAPVLARLVPPPLGEDIVRINKISQNLHAQLLLRRAGTVAGTGSLADGLAAERAMLTAAGVPRGAYDFADGSGMSSYNRVTPRGVVTFLNWVARQPWGTTWRATLPVAGEGTLTRRFGGGALDGKLWAKTGSLNATSALAGYLVTKSGRTLTFAAYANDIPEDAGAAAAIDKALLLIAAEN